MTIDEADSIIEQIDRLAEQIENDKELEALDPRYKIMASWLETSVDDVDAG